MSQYVIPIQCDVPLIINYGPVTSVMITESKQRLLQPERTCSMHPSCCSSQPSLTKRCWRTSSLCCVSIKGHVPLRVLPKQRKRTVHLLKAWGSCTLRIFSVVTMWSQWNSWHGTPKPCNWLSGITLYCCILQPSEQSEIVWFLILQLIFQMTWCLLSIIVSIYGSLQPLSTITYPIYPRIKGMGGWRKSQLTLGEKQSTPWTCTCTVNTCVRQFHSLYKNWNQDSQDFLAIHSPKLISQ